MNPLPPPPPAPNQIQWYYSTPDGKSVGPLSLHDLTRLASEGEITNETFVIENGASEWKRYGDISGSNPSSLSATDKKQPRRWPTILCLLFLYPIGVVVLWLGKAFSPTAKIVLTFGFGLLFLIAMTKEKEPDGTSETYAADIDEQSGPSEPKRSRKSRSSKPIMTVERGDIFQLGDFTYCFREFEVTSEVSSVFGVETAPDDGLFLIVYYTIGNESNETKTVLTDDIVMRDGKGRIYRSSSRVNTALMMGRRNKDFILSELHPGLTKSTVTAFEVPINATGNGWVLVVKEKGLFGSETIEVKLPPL